MRTDVYQKVTDTVVAQLEKGVQPWFRPWQAEHPAGSITRPSRANGVPYQGINVVMLWAASMEAGYVAPVWMTFRQASELGGNVRKGERGSLVVYASTFTCREEDAESGAETDREVPFMKGYTVFNLEQIEGLPERFAPVPCRPLDEAVRIERAEAFVTGTGATLRTGGDRAFYSPGSDVVQVPLFSAFRDAESYYATLAHELTHWTGHRSRLDRDLGGKRFGDQGYAMEELVAELGAAFLCADLGLEAEPREDHAAYPASWLKVLRGDKRAIFSAAAHAQRAADWLQRPQGADMRDAA